MLGRVALASADCDGLPQERDSVAVSDIEKVAELETDHDNELVSVGDIDDVRDNVTLLDGVTSADSDRRLLDIDGDVDRVEVGSDVNDHVGEWV